MPSISSTIISSNWGRERLSWMLTPDSSKRMQAFWLRDSSCLASAMARYTENPGSFSINAISLPIAGLSVEPLRM
jgi:hypothetical protein